jgi:hypothetical protein
MKDPVRHSQLRTVQYDHVDGTPELGFGLLFLLVAILFLIFAKIPGFASSGLSIWSIMLVFIGGGFLIGHLTQVLKEKLTYPRTGYLAYPRQGRPIKRSTRLLIWIGVPFATIVLLILLLLNRGSFPTQETFIIPPWVPGITGLLFGGLWVIAGWKISLPRYYLIGAATFLASLAPLFIGIEGNLGMALLFGIMSLVLFASGGIALWRYLRRNPVPHEEPNEQ